MNNICKITIKDEVYSVVSGLSDYEMRTLYDDMSYLVEGAKFMPLVKSGLWDGKIPFFSAEGEIYTRLIPRIEDKIDRWGYDFELEDLRIPITPIETRIHKDWFIDKGIEGAKELRPYQVSAINACLDNQSGFILAATGAGKCLHGDTWITSYQNGEAKGISYASWFENLRGLYGKEFINDVPVDLQGLGFQFETPTGLADVVAAVVKTDILYQIGIVDITTGKYTQVKCAAGHHFISIQGDPIQADQMHPGTELQGRDGRLEVTSVVNTGLLETFYDVSIDTPEHTYYDHNGILHHNTWMVAGLTDLLADNNVRSLVIVPSDDLVKQTVETLLQACLDVGVYSGTTKDTGHDVVVATWQALQNNPTLITSAASGNTEASRCIRTGFQALVVDEAHGAKAKVVGELINRAGGRIPYRFGFTGTLPTPEIDLMTLEGSIGEVLFSITARELMDMGYLAEVEIQPVEIIDDVPENFPDYTSEKTFLAGSQARVEFIADFAISRAEELGNTLILVNSVKQGKKLEKMIKGAVFLHGADDTKTRKMWYELFDQRDDLIVIATYGIASTGISIDRIYHLILVDGGKSDIRIIQSIGRSLRKGRDKSKAIVSDLYSSLKWSKAHFNKRKKMYKDAGYPTLKPQKVIL